MNSLQIPNTFCSLPFEDIVWIIGKLDCEDEENEEVWTVVDCDKSFIGAYTRKGDDSLKTCVEKLLRDCMTVPLSWKPRRPKYITYRNSESRVSSVDFSQFGVIYIDNEHFKPSHKHADLSGPIHHAPMQSCSTCRRRGTPELFFTCEKCKAIYYCSEHCMSQDNSGMIDGLGHCVWCHKMALYVEETEKLADLPFTFSADTTNSKFDERAYKDFQSDLGIYGQGLWRREGPCPQELGLPNYGELLLDDTNNNFVLLDLNDKYGSNAKSAQNSSNKDSFSCNVSCVTNWEKYYKCRGLELKSPAAVLMQWPLTVYHILNSLMKADYPHKATLLETDNVIKIHIIGAEKEVDILPVFYELERLMPTKSFEVMMIGCEISKKCEKQTFSSRRMKFIIEKGFYHSTVRPEAHVVIGFNAGLGAYQTWMETLRYLKQTETAAYFTDYCHYSCECARSPMEGLQLGHISDIRINPFHSPIRKYSEGNAFPWYSNGFIYCLLYGD